MATQKRWTEEDVAELGAVMIQADKLEDAIEEIYLSNTPTDEVHEMLLDAQYHAHKAYWLLSRLAIQATRESNIEEMEREREFRAAVIAGFEFD